MNNIEDTALALFELRRSLLAGGADGEFQDVVEQSDRMLPQADWEFDQLSGKASAMVEELDSNLTKTGWQQPGSLTERPFGERWVYGIVPRRAPLRVIMRGFLEPVRRVPLVREIPDRVVLYLRAKFPEGDGLEREQHGGVGWHYHYIDEKHRRSDVILSFDTRWTTPATKLAGSLAALRPLFVERHGEGKARFKARPQMWCDEKRESMYEVCARDLGRGIDQFRCAKNGSDAVWPRGVPLTPHPGTGSQKRR